MFGKLKSYLWKFMYTEKYREKLALGNYNDFERLGWKQDRNTLKVGDKIRCFQWQCGCTGGWRTVTAIALAKWDSQGIKHKGNNEMAYKWLSPPVEKTE